MTVASIVSRDIWSLAHGTHEGVPLLVRVRQEFNQSTNVEGYPKLILVKWAFQGDPAGLPSGADQAQMERFENRLVTAVELDLAAVLVAVITTGGVRTWALYGRSVKTFSDRLHAMPQEQAQYPIDVEARDDPRWTFLHESVVAGLKPSSAGR